MGCRMPTGEKRDLESATRKENGSAAPIREPLGPQAVDWAADIHRLVARVESLTSTLSDASWKLRLAVRQAPSGVLARLGFTKAGGTDSVLQRLGVSKGSDEHIRFYLDSNPVALQLARQASWLLLFLAGVVETEPGGDAPRVSGKLVTTESAITVLGSPALPGSPSYGGKLRNHYEIVNWRSRQQVRDFLQTTTRTPVKLAFVSTIMGRLKAAIKKHDGRVLILSGPKGYRLALRKGGVYHLL